MTDNQKDITAVEVQRAQERSEAIKKLADGSYILNALCEIVRVLDTAKVPTVVQTTGKHPRYLTTRLRIEKLIAERDAAMAEVARLTAESVKDFNSAEDQLAEKDAIIAAVSSEAKALVDRAQANEDAAEVWKRRAFDMKKRLDDVAGGSAEWIDIVERAG